MKMYSQRSAQTFGGFTLVEVLVSITVLGLMMIGVAQMLNSSITATLGGYKHMDADTQARMVLDRMAYDISKITKRSDVDYYFQKNTGNDQMAFYSESSGYYPSGLTGTTQESEVSLVGYMINSSNQLVRLSKGLVWNGVNTTAPAMVFNPLANSATSSITSNTITTTPWNGAANGIQNGNDPNYQVIGDQVFRLEYCFLVENTSASAAAAPAAQTTTILSDSPWYTTDTSPNGLQDVLAVVVSIAVLDNESRGMVSSAQLKTAASDLKDDGATTATLPLTIWKANLLSNGLGLPKAAAAQVRFYQRYCYINHVQ
jgi:prepilin-type N-terminal cleavage/methylation domain-containing protein